MRRCALQLPGQLGASPRARHGRCGLRRATDSANAPSLRRIERTARRRVESMREAPSSNPRRPPCSNSLRNPPGSTLAYSATTLAPAPGVRFHRPRDRGFLVADHSSRCASYAKPNLFSVNRVFSADRMAESSHRRSPISTSASCTPSSTRSPCRARNPSRARRRRANPGSPACSN
jgi:hypothetical protein